MGVYAELVVGVLFLVLGLAIGRREVVVLPEGVAEFVGLRLAMVGVLLAAASLAVWVGLVPPVTIQVATFLALLLAVSTAIELRLR